MQDHSPQGESDSILSSVRRIVSRDEASYAEAESVNEKLLLTPSLRVDPNVSDAELADIPMPSRDRMANRVQTRMLTTERQSLEQRIADLERAVSRVDQEWEPDGSEKTPLEQEPSLSVRARESSQATPSARPQTRPETPAEPAPASPSASAETTARPAASRSRFASPPPSDTAPDAQSNVRPLHERAAEPARPAPEPPHLRAVPTPPEPEPKPEPERQPESANEMHMPEASDQPEENAFADLSDALDFDEEALRDLVAEVVRAELQGELGERITRNVRKLVRREIHRALMTRDFR